MLHAVRLGETMTELSGTLDGVGLPAIVRFLMGLKKTGSLRLDQEDWHGTTIASEVRLRNGKRKGPTHV